MRSTFLQFAPPSIGEDEIAEVVDTLRSGWITTGPRATAFEREFAATVGAHAALALSSGTAALHLALLALGVGPGDAVIGTDLTFCSSIHVIEHAGARPVLVDVEPETLDVDPARVEEAAADPTVRAIMPVHLYGHPCDMDALLEVAAARGVAIVHDAAHALAACHRGRLIGSASPGGRGPVELAAFSFYATKNLTTGEGGMLTGPAALVERARLLSLHGMSRDAHRRYGADGSWFYEVTAAGFKCNMPDLQAALGLAQLRRLPAMQARRRQLAARYGAAFAGLEEVTVPPERPGVVHAWHLYALRLNLETLRIDRADFIRELTARNIGASVHFIPVHLHPYYRDRYGLRPTDFPVTAREYPRLVSLPLHPGMTDQDADDVIEAVHDIVRAHRR